MYFQEIFLSRWTPYWLKLENWDIDRISPAAITF